MAVSTVGTFNLLRNRPNNSVEQVKLLKERGINLCAFQEIDHQNYRFGAVKFNSIDDILTTKNVKFGDIKMIPSDLSDCQPFITTMETL
ncbi:hypothetical protein OZX67_01840 [Bifidobacterium sp. ESL0728]|uniref:hypothetical protein n=1 Tax=Bifidobacterium sp. ESL0728 TaxID=2983220 RepID=UPI0023F9B0C4|nr:hypothetical protein [Bifidobacterium sp. ESL0728]WEV59333.1 hypothetical protein OZX67_01840 [Bifidobacterium sp. ESL0728]